MMKSCARCSNWAQWQVLVEEKQDDEVISPTEKKLIASGVCKERVPRGKKFRLIEVLCAVHKAEHQREAHDLPVRYEFVGAMRVGA